MLAWDSGGGWGRKDSPGLGAGGEGEAMAVGSGTLASSQPRLGLLAWSPSQPCWPHRIILKIQRNDT